MFSRSDGHIFVNYGRLFLILVWPPAQLREGIRLEGTLGVNPFQIGFVGSTDSHVAAPGAVEENNYQGNHGAQSIIGRGDAPQLPDRVEQNAGGRAGLYAEETTRDALCAAMRRKEAYGTSGTRINLRFFGGWDYPSELCETSDLVARSREAFGRIDVLVNNAGYSPGAALEQVSRDELRHIFDVNLLAGLQLVQEIAPIMRAHGDRQCAAPPEGFETCGNEPWSYGQENLPILNATIWARELLRPYVDGEMDRASAEGRPIMRPLFLDFPGDPAARAVDDAATRFRCVCS